MKSICPRCGETLQITGETETQYNTKCGCGNSAISKVKEDVKPTHPEGERTSGDE